MKSLLNALLFAFSLSAQAGWVSAGGGELYMDSHNPWFLKNISSVNYCFQVAPNSVSVSVAQVRTAFQAALSYWAGEFQKVNQGPGGGQFALGNQTFTEVDCTNRSLNLSILVGYETLSSNAITFMVAPTDYIGMAVRTNYTADLVGTGFIFISSDIGTTSYHGGTDPNLIPKAWSQPMLLQYAFMHELGHMYGLPHLGAGVMTETFLEQMLSPNLSNSFSTLPVESFFAPNNELDFCGVGMINTDTLAWFGAPSNSCLHLSTQGNRQWIVYSRAPGATINGPKLGTLMGGMPDLTDLSVRPAIVLQLDGNTSIFTPQETLYRPFMFGPQLVQFGVAGNFIPTTGAAKPVYIKQQPDSLQVQGLSGTKLEMLLNYFSPLGVILTSNPTPGPNRQGKK